MMHLFLIVVSVLLGLVALVLILALLMRKDHYVQRSIVVDVPSQKAFDYLKLVKNQETFNKQAMVAPDRNKEYTGTDGTVGYVYAWRGDTKAGEGAKEIKHLIEGQRIEMEIRFTKPMKAQATVIMAFETVAPTQTKISWSNTGRLIYPVNVMIPLMEKMVAKDMDSSLLTLKSILENN